MNSTSDGAASRGIQMSVPLRRTWKRSVGKKWHRSAELVHTFRYSWSRAVLEESPCTTLRSWSVNSCSPAGPAALPGVTLFCLPHKETRDTCKTEAGLEMGWAGGCRELPTSRPLAGRRTVPVLLVARGLTSHHGDELSQCHVGPRGRGTGEESCLVCV